MPTPHEIARGLTKAQREALLTCAPWDVEVGAGPAIAFIANGLLQDSTILDDGVEWLGVAFLFCGVVVSNATQRRQ